MPKRRQPEFQIQSTVCQHLQLRASPGVLWLHVPNQNRSAKIGALLKRMGVLPGASDLLLWHDGNSFALELKAPGGRPTESQLDFQARFADAGGHVAIADSIDRALTVLEAWGLLRGQAT